MPLLTRPPRFTALAGAAEPLWFLGAATVFGLARPGYDLTHAISELGQQGSPGAVTWNIVGFGVAALLYALFAASIRVALGDGWLFRTVAAQAIFLGLGGTFSCDPGCPPIMSSWQGWAHTVAGLTYFALTCIAPLVAWRTLVRDSARRSSARASLIAGVILIGLFLAGPTVFKAEFIGFWQRITLAIAGAWTTYLSITLWRSARIAREGSAPAEWSRSQPSHG